jgi:hypothetical protein
MQTDRLDLILTAATEGFWDWDLRTDRAYLSPRYCELVGYDPDDTIFDSHFLKRIIHPDDHGHVFKIIDEHLQGIRTHSIIEYRMIAKDGTMRWIEGRGKIVAYDAHGMPTRMVGTIVDISERKHAEQRAFAMLPNLPDLFVARFDTNLRHQYVSPSIEKITGLPQELYLGKTNREMGMPENLVLQWDDALREVITTGQPRQIEFCYSSQDGPRYYSSYLTPGEASDGSLTSVTCFVRDITQRKLAEKALQEQELLFRTLTTIAPVGIYLTDPEGNCLYANPFWCKMAGLGLEEARGQGWVNGLHPDDRELVWRNWRQTIDNHEPWGLEYRFLNPQGTVTNVFGLAAPVTEPSGRLTGYVGVNIDMTALRDSEESFQRLFHSMRDCFAQTKMTGEIVRVNPSFLAMLGYSAAEVMALRYQDLTPSRWHGFEQEIVEKQILVHGYSEVYEKEYRRKDGSLFPVELRTFLLRDAAGEPVGMWAIVRDITERKYAEERVARSLDEKTVMLQEIHHRVKNNLQIIYSLLNLQAKGITDEGLRGKFEESKNRVLSMSLIHEQLYRAENFAHVNFKKYLEDLLRSIAGTYKQDEITFSVDMDAVTLDVNVGIPCGLIVNELVSNSCKHAFPHGGQGSVRVGVNRLGTGGYLLFVEDNGIGWPKDIDLHHTSSLGLTLVDGLSKQIRGKIELSSEGGAKFRMTFQGTLDSG